MRLLRVRAKALAARARGQVPLHFLHVGKTGGSAIKHALRGRRDQGPYRLFLHGHRMGLKNVWPGERVFFCVRDPIARFVSGFFSRQRMGRPKNDIPWNEPEAVAFERFSTPDELAEALGSSKPSRRAEAEQAMNGIQHVNSHMWEWFGDEALFHARRESLLWIGFQESLSEDFKRLRQLLQLPDEASLPSDDLRAHRNPQRLGRGLSEAAEANLRSWYAADYRLLALCEAWRADHRD